MADYISREAAIDAIWKPEVRPNNLIFDALRRACEEEVKHIPAADVVEVVLCRDCKHFNPYPGDCTDGGIEGVCKRHNSLGVLVMDEDFCSDAERI